jgi:hypothetical protein
MKKVEYADELQRWVSQTLAYEDSEREERNIARIGHTIYGTWLGNDNPTVLGYRANTARNWARAAFRVIR